MKRKKRGKQKKEQGTSKRLVFGVAALLIMLVIAAAFIFSDNPFSVDGAEWGDTVSFNFVLRLENGTIFDTSIKSIAMASGILDEEKNYAPLNARLTASGSGFIPGVIEGLVGM